MSLAEHIRSISAVPMPTREDRRQQSIKQRAKVNPTGPQGKPLDFRNDRSTDFAKAEQPAVILQAPKRAKAGRSEVTPKARVGRACVVDGAWYSSVALASRETGIAEHLIHWRCRQKMAGYRYAAMSAGRGLTVHGRKFDSIAEASRVTGIPQKTVSDRCDDNRPGWNWINA